MKKFLNFKLTRKIMKQHPLWCHLHYQYRNILLTFLLSTVNNLLLAGIDQYPVDAQPVLKVHLVSVRTCPYKWVNLQQIWWNFQVKFLKNCPLQLLGVIRSKSNLAADDIITNSIVWGFLLIFTHKKCCCVNLFQGLCAVLFPSSHRGYLKIDQGSNF